MSRIVIRNASNSPFSRVLSPLCNIYQICYCRSLEDILGARTFGPNGRRKGDPGHNPEDYDKFIDLIQRMLTYDPKLRIKPDQALNHPFFKRSSSVDRPKNLQPITGEQNHQSLIGLPSLTDMLVSPLKAQVEIKMETSSPENKQSYKYPVRPQVGKLLTLFIYFILIISLIIV